MSSLLIGDDDHSVVPRVVTTHRISGLAAAAEKVPIVLPTVHHPQQRLPLARLEHPLP
ncbi:hypothetical protein AB5J62_04815 [Amycolatopsis sp. cg5]|uniref:hypothetical protein n=1 Tax=Amycolatopsis sp. cg5 TaxID=3238802 RepID=UPI003523AAB7